MRACVRVCVSFHHIEIYKYRLLKLTIYIKLFLLHANGITMCHHLTILLMPNQTVILGTDLAVPPSHSCVKNRSGASERKTMLIFSP